MKVVSTRQGGLSAAGEANLQSVVDKAMAKEKSSAEVKKKRLPLSSLFSSLPLSSHLLSVLGARAGNKTGGGADCCRFTCVWSRRIGGEKKDESELAKTGKKKRMGTPRLPRLLSRFFSLPPC